MEQLKQIIFEWVRKVAWQHHLPKEQISSTSATILAYGSYGLGVHGSDSDIDALCVGPYFATLEEDFFIVLRSMLLSRPEVSDIHCVKSAKVPLMRFKFNGISVDFPYAQLRASSVPDGVDLFNPHLAVADETSWRSLSGVLVNKRILQLVPHLKNFQSMLRCIKLWARRRGVYSHLLGFFGGIHLAILAAYVCQRFPNGSINALVTFFFENFSLWPWPKPVILQDSSIPFRYPDSRSLMPIMMPCSPFGWCNSNITKSTYSKIKEELQRGYLITRDSGRADFEWSCLFEPFPYTNTYASFLGIFLTAPDDDELGDWVGWVKSRFLSLLLKLEAVQGYCDPNPTEYVDHSVSDPNVVFCWGLSPNGSNLTDIISVKEDFMRSVNKDLYSDSKRNRCKLELLIVESSQLPKSLQLGSGASGASKACWRVSEYNQQQRRPIYSQYFPQYFVGYVAPQRDYDSAVG
ncbi:nuclear poly(A) polymerase 3 isoform X2 [Iris pallida]|uniref:Poly(A) polymerase n=1 Tax=Iris pallida TaxID=29817 RepID=A0AAX6DR62_IRIPA|nr:nuclear poly(A) polymerase 3 isoform X2 [Iris pallida]KAJ6808811.1 nuclear poly(A) polymerase 3 isoform X2 [Iris pallida]